MENSFGLRGGTATHAFDEVTLVKVVRDLALGEVLIFFTTFQVVDGNHVGNATFIESENIVTANKASGTSDKNTHDINP